MHRPGVKTEVDRIEREEAVLLDTLLKARHEAGLTQADVAERMGTLPSAVARLRVSSVHQMIEGLPVPAGTIHVLRP